MITLGDYKRLDMITFGINDKKWSTFQRDIIKEKYKRSKPVTTMGIMRNPSAYKNMVKK